MMVGWIRQGNRAGVRLFLELRLVKRVTTESGHKQDGFSAGLVLSPVCGLESWDFDTDSYRHGKRRQCRLWRMSTDIKVLIPRVALMQVGYSTE
jgi:hypothetical protein